MESNLMDCGENLKLNFCGEKRTYHPGDKHPAAQKARHGVQVT
jgi:hypothetical protein